MIIPLSDGETEAQRGEILYPNLHSPVKLTNQSLCSDFDSDPFVQQPLSPGGETEVQRRKETKFPGSGPTTLSIAYGATAYNG